MSFCYYLHFPHKNVDIKFSAHDVFLELHLPGTLKAKIFERQIILKYLGARKPKGSQLSQNSANVTYIWWGGTLALVIITWFRNCKLQ